MKFREYLNVFALSKICGHVNKFNSRFICYKPRKHLNRHEYHMMCQTLNAKTGYICCLPYIHHNDCHIAYKISNDGYYFHFSDEVIRWKINEI